jgi:hypothetical protein
MDYSCFRSKILESVRLKIVDVNKVHRLGNGLFKIDKKPIRIEDYFMVSSACSKFSNEEFHLMDNEKLFRNFT